PSDCFTRSSFGPLQKLTRTFVASGALIRTSTLPAPSTRGYSAPQTFVAAGRNSPDSWAEQRLATRKSAHPAFFMSTPPACRSHARIGVELALAVFEPVEVRGLRRARHVLAGHAHERAREVGQARGRRLVREDAGVELLRQPLPVPARRAVAE